MTPSLDPAPRAAASAEPVRPWPFVLLTAGSVNTVLDPATPFGRVRATDDETRGDVQVSAPGTRQTVRVVLQTQPAFYGIDYGRLSKKNTPIPAKTMGQLQQLFEDTPLSYLGIYLAPAPNHSNTDWMKKAAALVAQGWALIPFYVGRQQSGTNPTFANIDPGQAKNQGTADGNQAVAQAQQVGLPADSVLWLDMENSASFVASTLKYVDAWRAAVTASGFKAGVYVLAPVAEQLHNHGADIPLWVTRAWYFNPTVNDPARRVLDDNLDVGGECRIVPVGQQDPMRKPVQLGKPADVPLNGPASKHWEFVNYAVGWQYVIDWPGDNTPVLPSWTDTGSKMDFPMITGGVDLNLSDNTDPAETANGALKTARRRRVTRVTVDPAKVAAGAQAKITVTLDRSVAPDADLVVLLRCSVSELILATSVSIPRGTSQATVTATAVAAPAEVSGTITARTVHQLSAILPSVDVTVGATVS